MDKNIQSLIQGHDSFHAVKFAENEARFKKLVEEGKTLKHSLLDVVTQG